MALLGKEDARCHLDHAAEREHATEHDVARPEGLIDGDLVALVVAHVLPPDDPTHRLAQRRAADTQDLELRLPRVDAHDLACDNISHHRHDGHLGGAFAQHRHHREWLRRVELSHACTARVHMVTPYKAALASHKLTRAAELLARCDDPLGGG